MVVKTRRLGNGHKICRRCLYSAAPENMPQHLLECWGTETTLTSAERPTPQASGMTVVRQWAREEVRKRQLEAELRRIKAEQREREPAALEYLAHEGINRVAIAEGTVYLQRSVWARLADDRDAAHDALRKAGLGDMVRESVNTQTLSAWVREVGEENIPPNVAPHVQVTQAHHVRLRKI